MSTVPLDDLFDNLFTMGEIRQIRGAMDGYAASMEARATAHDTHGHFCPRCRVNYICPRPEICNAEEGEAIICNECIPDEGEDQ